jgi:hypothetical protein
LTVQSVEIIKRVRIGNGSDGKVDIFAISSFLLGVRM